MSGTVIPFTPYHVQQKMDQGLGRLLAKGLVYRVPEDMLELIRHLWEVSEEMGKALDALQRQQTVEMFERSLERISNERRTP